jgi:ABC-2 type transport system ATP-binding protein
MERKMTKPIVTINSLSRMIDKKTVLDCVDGSIEQGDVVALIGENGAGKTTLIETILGFSPPTSGAVRLFQDEPSLSLNDKTKQMIGYVPQQDDLLEFMSVNSYLNSVASFYDHWNKELIESLMTLWKVPANRRVSKLSIGQKQMVSILAALGHEPTLLILDEPVSSLDPSSRRKFLQTLVEIQLNKPISILFSTHIVTDVERVANRLWILKSGQLVLDDSIDNLKEKSDQSVEDLFLEVNQ